MHERLVIAEKKRLVGGHRLDHRGGEHGSAATTQRQRQRFQIDEIMGAEQRREAGFQEIELVRPDRETGAGFEQGREDLESRRCHRPIISRIFGAMRASGRTA